MEFLSYLRRHPYRLVLPLCLLLFLSFGTVHWFRGSVVLIVAGQSHHVYSRKLNTVADLLIQERITLRPLDFCTPPQATFLTRNMVVKVTRVDNQEVTQTVETAPVVQWSHRTRTNLRRVLVEKGHSTEHLQKFRITLYDGKEVDRHLTSVRTGRRPFYTLTLFNNSGFILRKYDLLKSKTLKMLATGYYVGDPMVPGDETRLGYKLQRGLVAVDPKVIPLGTRLYIPTYGYAFASDTGSAIQGMRIDLAVKDAAEERQFNHRKVTIFILDKGRKW